MIAEGRIFIRSPFDILIVNKLKAIETAHIALPERFIGKWLNVQNEQRQFVGMVRLESTFKYTSAEQFDDDFVLHHVDKQSPYHFNNRRFTHAWVVDEAVAFTEMYCLYELSKPKPMPAPPMKSQFRLELY